MATRACQQPDCIATRRCYETVLSENILVHNENIRFRDENIRLKSFIEQKFRIEDTHTNPIQKNQQPSSLCNWPNFLSQWSYLKSEEKELPCHDLTRNDIPDINLQKLAIKQNDAFARHQGNSLEDDDVKSLWQKLFVNEAERDIPEDYTHSQKNEVLCFLCELFMDIKRDVQGEVIERMAKYLREFSTLKPEWPYPEINQKEVERAYRILWQLVCPHDEQDKQSEIDAEIDAVVDRMTDWLRALFSPQRHIPDNKSDMMTNVEVAFSILLNIPQEVFEFSVSLSLEKFEKQHKLTTFNGDTFAQDALSLCVKMSTRVPPYIISNDEKRFVQELHELKYVRGGPDPVEHLEIPVSYLRPIVYHNYQGNVLIPGKVIGSCTLAHNPGDTAAQYPPAGSILSGNVSSPTPAHNGGDTAAGSSDSPTAQQPTTGKVSRSTPAHNQAGDTAADSPIVQQPIAGKVKSPTPTQNAGDTAAGSSVLPTAQQPTAGKVKSLTPAGDTATESSSDSHQPSTEKVVSSPTPAHNAGDTAAGSYDSPDARQIDAEDYWKG